MLTRPSFFAILLTLAGASVVCAERPPTEQQIVGTWEYLSIDAVGRISFSPNHHVTVSFLMDANGQSRPSRNF